MQTTEHQEVLELNLPTIEVQEATQLQLTVEENLEVLPTENQYQLELILLEATLTQAQELLAHRQDHPIVAHTGVLTAALEAVVHQQQEALAVAVHPEAAVLEALVEVAVEALAVHQDHLLAVAVEGEETSKSIIKQKKIEMKKYFTFIFALACVFVSAQNINDVLRYSTDNTQGTARYQAMSGAFGALGGDLSSMNINPAGSAVFNNTQLTFSGTNYHVKNQTSYGNSFSPYTTQNNFDMNQIGGVFVFNNKALDSDWKKISIGFNFDKVQLFDNYTNSSYTTTRGIDNYFLNFAQGVPLGPLKLQNGEYIEEAYLDIGSSLGFVEQQAFLGVFGGVIDAVDPNDDDNTDYLSNSAYSTVNQTYRKSTTGYNDKYTFNIASQYQDNLYLGASLNVHSILYNQLTELREDGYDSNSPVQSTTFDNLLRSQGNAFSFSLGAIAKLNSNVRIGGSYQSPTWYRLSEEFSQRINSTIADVDINFINFNTINLYDKYTIKTPGKLTGSLALVFGKDGLLSLDYGYQDMSKAELRPVTDSNFNAENGFIGTQLGGVSSIRLGGEYRIKQISLRAGYRYEQSPYVDKTIGDLNGISGGIGYNFGPSKLDLAVNGYSQNSKENILSTDPSPALNIDRNNTNVTLSYTINF